MNKNSQTVRKLTVFSLFLAIELLLFFTPLGFIRIGVISATLMHIPVIAAGILLGRREGALLGLVFGLCSVLNATMAPTVTSFVFSPFVTIGGLSGNWTSLVIAIVPRVLLGWCSGLFYDFCLKRGLHKGTAGILTGVLAAAMHTAMVLSLIYILFGQDYSTAIGKAYDVLVVFMMTTVLTNGIPEAICAGLCCGALAKVLGANSFKTVQA